MGRQREAGAERTGRETRLSGMLIVLPPSETKAFGGHGPALSAASLTFPELNDTRHAIATDLVALSPDRMQEVLELSDRLRPEVEANHSLRESPTMPAIHRYTGVLYDALDAATLSDAALSRLAIGSALFGVVGAADLIPHYRLSGSTKLPTADGATPTMKARWGTAITEALASVDGLVVDLRSGAYQQLGKLADAVTVRVESLRADGTRKVVSHFNKFYKGQLARVLAQADKAPVDATGVAEIARQAGMTVEEGTAKTETLTLVV